MSAHRKIFFMEREGMRGLKNSREAQIFQPRRRYARLLRVSYDAKLATTTK
jgi:hypothetical protein